MYWPAPAMCAPPKPKGHQLRLWVSDPELDPGRRDSAGTRVRQVAAQFVQVHQGLGRKDQVEAALELLEGEPDPAAFR